MSPRVRILSTAPAPAVIHALELAAQAEAASPSPESSEVLSRCGVLELHREACEERSALLARAAELLRALVPPAA